MDTKRLAWRIGLLAIVAAMLGGCCVLPFRHGGHGDYREHRDNGGGPRHDSHRPG